MRRAARARLTEYVKPGRTGVNRYWRRDGSPSALPVGSHRETGHLCELTRDGREEDGEPHAYEPDSRTSAARRLTFGFRQRATLDSPIGCGGFLLPGTTSITKRTTLHAARGAERATERGTEL